MPSAHAIQQYVLSELCQALILLRPEKKRNVLECTWQNMIYKDITLTL